MIKTDRYENKQDALDDILKIDRDYTIIKHNFRKGEIIEPHSHPVDEWVVFDSGRCKITLDSDSKVVGPGKCSLAIYLPKNKIHSLECLSDILYWVVRETENSSSD